MAFRVSEHIRSVFVLHSSTFRVEEMPAGTSRVVVNVKQPAKIAYFVHFGGIMIPLEPKFSKIGQKLKNLFGQKLYVLKS